MSFFASRGGRKVDFPLLYEKSDPLAAGRSAHCGSSKEALLELRRRWQSSAGIRSQKAASGLLEDSEAATVLPTFVYTMDVCVFDGLSVACSALDPR